LLLGQDSCYTATPDNNDDVVVDYDDDDDDKIIIVIVASIIAIYISPNSIKIIKKRGRHVYE
jgi:hypothetical protein